MATPSSQKADRRPISFVLTNEIEGTTVQVTPPIRPEDLTRNESSLMTPTQTLGGAYIDDFGPGLSTISISGHTGWRGGQYGDGVQSFTVLRNYIWVEWHARRAAAVAAGQSPDVVKLIFADALDGIVNVVAPGSFALKRNKARPLLMMYNLNMTVLSERVDPALIDSLNLNGLGEQQRVAGIDSLLDSVSRLESAAANVRSWVDTNIAGPVQEFLSTTTRIFNMAIESVSSVQGLVTQQANQLVSIATDLAEAGRTMFHTYNAVAGLDDFARNQVSRVASAYENAMCILRNVFRAQQQYPDYQGLYGASSCSSTVGGSPLSLYRNENPFEVVIPPAPPPPTLTASAIASIEAVKASDPVLNPMTLSELGGAFASIGDGVLFA